MEEKKYFCKENMNPKKSRQTLDIIFNTVKYYEQQNSHFSYQLSVVKRVIFASINLIKAIQGKLDIRFYKSNYFE